MKFNFLLKVNGKENAQYTDHLASITVTDESGTIDDQLALGLVLNEKLVVPNLGDLLSISLGPDNDMIDWGEYEIRELEAEESILKIRAYASEALPSLRTQRKKSWDSELGELVQTIAKTAKTLAVVDTALSKERVKTVQSESDISFLHRLAKEHGAILKINSKKIVFVTAETKDAPKYTIQRSFPWSWKKDKKVTGVIANYWDKELKKHCPVLVGEEGITRHVQGSFSTKEKAITRAQSRLLELKTKNETMKITVPCTSELNTSKIACGSYLEITTLPKFVTGSWFVTKVEHNVTPDQGLISHFDCTRNI